MEASWENFFWALWGYFILPVILKILADFVRWKELPAKEKEKS